MNKNLVLLGMMAVGKTALGKIVAKKLSLEFIDTDLNIEKKNSMTIGDIFKNKGENFFRLEEEKEVIESLRKKNCIIAIGGGAFINKTLRDKILKSSISIWLEVDIKTLNDRLKWNKKRPLLKKINNLNKLEKLYEKRRDIYNLANHKITCDGLRKKAITDKIIELYEK